MDPVTAIGLIASIAQLIAVTSDTITYLNDVKDAPKDRAKLLREAASLLSILTGLRCRIEDTNDTDPWLIGVRSLGAKHGPFDQLKEAMEELAKRLQPAIGSNKMGRRLLWTLDKRNIEDTLSKIERLKTLILLAQQNDQQ